MTRRLCAMVMGMLLVAISSNARNYTSFLLTPPTVAITLPQEGATFLDNEAIVFNFTATDDDGTIQVVQLYDEEDELIGESFESPWVLTIATLPPGTHKFYAQALDDEWDAGQSEMITIHINDHTNPPPTVSITSPMSGATFLDNESISFTFDPQDFSGTVQQVRLYDDAENLFGEVTSSPWELTIDPISAGSYSFFVQVTDTNGETGDSEKITVYVEQAVNTAPTVSLENPSVGGSYYVDQMIRVKAKAEDTGGQVTLVKFYINNSLVNSDTSFPFEFDWTPTTAGPYEFQAIAVDNKNALTASALVNISVTLNTGIEELDISKLQLFPNPASDRIQLEWDALGVIQTIDLVTITGVILKSIRVEKKQQLSLGLANLSKGIYFLRLNNEQQQHTLRFIKTE